MGYKVYYFNLYIGKLNIFCIFIECLFWLDSEIFILYVYLGIDG